MKDGTWSVKNLRRLARTLAVVVVTYQELGTTVSESKTEFMRLWVVPRPTEAALHIEVARQGYRQTAKVAYLGDSISAGTIMSIGNNRRISAG